jgi:hypothetical protein
MRVPKIGLDVALKGTKCILNLVTESLQGHVPDRADSEDELCIRLSGALVDRLSTLEYTCIRLSLLGVNYNLTTIQVCTFHYRTPIEI